MKQLAVCLLMGLTLLAYLPARRCGYIWDDDAYVTENKTLRTAQGLWRMWTRPQSIPQYYPLVHTTYWLEYQLWELRPLGYHLTNIFLHGLNAVLLWLVLRHLSLPGAWLAAAVFALHPVHVESVAWITERKNVLSATCYFGALLAYLHFRPPGLTHGVPRGSPWLYFLTMTLFLGALFSKTVTASLPAAILVITWWKAGTLRWADVLPLLPMFAVGLALGLYTAHLETAHVGALGPEWDLTFWERFLVAGRAVWFYVGKLLWPDPLIFIYPRWEIDTGVWWQLLFPLAAAVVAACLWCSRNRIGRGPLAAVLLFVGTLFPALGFFNVYPMQYSFVADHFQYLASAAMITLVVAGTVHLLKSPQRAILHPLTAGAGIGLLFVVLIFLSWNQQSAYRDEESLWTDTLAKNPAAWMASNNRGLLYREQKKYQLALHDFSHTIRFKGDAWKAYNNRGEVYQLQGEHELALSDFTRAIELSSDPFARAYFGRGVSYGNLGNHQTALEDFTKVIELLPSFASAYFQRAKTQQQLGNHQDVLGDFSKAIEQRPDHSEAYLHRGMLYLELENPKLALEDFNKLLELRPRYAKAYRQRGHAQARLGRSQLAQRDYAKASQLKHAGNPKRERQPGTR